MRGHRKGNMGRKGAAGSSRRGSGQAGEEGSVQVKLRTVKKGEERRQEGRERGRRTAYDRCSKVLTAGP